MKRKMYNSMLKAINKIIGYYYAATEFEDSSDDDSPLSTPKHPSDIKSSTANSRPDSAPDQMPIKAHDGRVISPLSL